VGAFIDIKMIKLMVNWLIYPIHMEITGEKKSTGCMESGCSFLLVNFLRGK